MVVSSWPNFSVLSALPRRFFLGQQRVLLRLFRHIPLQENGSEREGVEAALGFATVRERFI